MEACQEALAVFSLASLMLAVTWTHRPCFMSCGEEHTRAHVHARTCGYTIGVPKKVMETNWMVLVSSNANLKDLYWINFSDFF